MGDIQGDVVDEGVGCLKILNWLNGKAISFSIRFGFKKDPSDFDEKHCIICGDLRKDHSGNVQGEWVAEKWVHEFQEFDING